MQRGQQCGFAAAPTAGIVGADDDDRVEREELRGRLLDRIGILLQCLSVDILQSAC